MLVREILLSWQSLNGGPGTSVLNFNTTIDATNQRDALADFLNGLAVQLGTNTRCTVATDGREFEDSTGELQGFWTAGGVVDVFGYGGTEVVANAAQGLMRIATEQVYDGRGVAGKMFIPGFARVAETNGELNSTARSLVATLGTTLIAEAGLGVWSRPRVARPAGPGGSPAAVPARAGKFFVGTAATAWNEFAVLRRRRS